jgi:hypothetical protein
MTPIDRTASPTDRPCDNRTSTWSSSATISSVENVKPEQAIEFVADRINGRSTVVEIK